MGIRKNLKKQAAGASQKAMEALFALEATWGGTINERMKRESEQWAAAEAMRKQNQPQQASTVAPRGTAGAERI